MLKKKKKKCLFTSPPHSASLWKVKSFKRKEVQYRNLVPEFCHHYQLSMFYRNRLMEPKNRI